MNINGLPFTKEQCEAATQACYEAKAEIEKLIGYDCPYDPCARCNVPVNTNCGYIDCPVIEGRE